MASPKTECEGLMNQALPIAERMLREHGEFYPYAYVLETTGKSALLAARDGSERPKSKTLIDMIRIQFRDGAKAGKYRATALVYDVRVANPSTGTKSDAIAVALDHRDGYSVVVIIPYTLKDGKYLPGPISAQKGDTDIFQANESR